MLLVRAQVQFLGAVTKTEPYMIVTEYMPGGSLTDVFRASKKMTTWRAVQVRGRAVRVLRCQLFYAKEDDHDDRAGQRRRAGRAAVAVLATEGHSAVGLCRCPGVHVHRGRWCCACLANASWRLKQCSACTQPAGAAEEAWLFSVAWMCTACWHLGKESFKKVQFVGYMDAQSF